jgi:nucleoside 2-deoxyribosyltransferase
MGKKIYLAIPYSFDPEKSFRIANEVTADLMSQGNIVFSPISHSHPVAEYLPPSLRTDSMWWMKQDLPMVDWCEHIVVVLIGRDGVSLVHGSSGVQMEISHATVTGKSLSYYNYETND